VKRLVLVVVLLLGACDSAPPAQVTVYVPTHFEEQANAWLRESGFEVTIIAGASKANTDLIVGKHDSPRADVLVTSGVVDIWYAADNGALRPIAGDAFEDLPDTFKDPDRMWAATASRYMTIGTAPGLDILTGLDLDKLAAPELSAQVCLSTSALEDNRVLIAMLIAEFGNRPAERIVRGWVRNLAAAPFASEEELIDALRVGDCRYGIISSAADAAGIDRIDLASRYYNVQGVGVTRHAQNPEAAQQLLNWMLAEGSWEELPASNSRNVGQAGWYEEEARLLAERAGYW
jgi:iron(III) transport system substrate-binding protein